jgi:hypothetical protein
MNFRSQDPEDWNLAFLQAIDLALSPAYAAAAQSDAQAAACLADIITAKGQIAAGLATLVAPRSPTVTPTACRTPSMR